MKDVAGLPGTVNRDSRGKPDPDEPFRYVCPTCGRQVTRRTDSRLWRCNGGHGSFTMNELVDKKKQ